MVSCDTCSLCPLGYSRASVRAICSGDQRQHSKSHTKQKKDRLWMQFTGRMALTAALVAALLATDAGIGAQFAVARKLTADCRGSALQHVENLSDAVVLLFEAADRHAFLGLHLLVTSGAGVNRLTLTDQVLHFRFQSSPNNSIHHSTFSHRHLFLLLDLIHERL
jgi:hypothetical protein